MSASAILGAGYSHVAGLPLTSNLFNAEVLVSSKRAKKHFAEVWEAWSGWHKNNPEKNAEQFLEYVYRSSAIQCTLDLKKWSDKDYKDNKNACSTYGSINFTGLWKWAVELVAAVLATPKGVDVGNYNLRYAGRITKPLKCPEHDEFWNIMTSNFELIGVITTNYDLLIERGLRHRKMIRTARPGVHYGGISQPQILKGLAQPFTTQKPDRLVELSGEIPLFKLHGSLNWSFKAERLVMYQDMRPSFRNGGDAAIIPPIPEKSIPNWLQQVWHEAKQILSKSDIWVVCGYSLHDYDIAMRNMITKAAKDSVNLTKIVIIDPHSNELKKQWEAISTKPEILCLPGLPDCLGYISEI
jgi:hypothetical protein